MEQGRSKRTNCADAKSPSTIDDPVSPVAPTTATLVSFIVKEVLYVLSLETNIDALVMLDFLT